MNYELAFIGGFADELEKQGGAFRNAWANRKALAQKLRGLASKVQRAGSRADAVGSEFKAALGKEWQSIKDMAAPHLEKTLAPIRREAKAIKEHGGRFAKDVAVTSAKGVLGAGKVGLRAAWQRGIVPASSAIYNRVLPPAERVAIQGVQGPSAGIVDPSLYARLNARMQQSEALLGRGAGLVARGALGVAAPFAQGAGAIGRGIAAIPGAEMQAAEGLARTRFEQMYGKGRLEQLLRRTGVRGKAAMQRAATAAEGRAVKSEEYWLGRSGTAERPSRQRITELTNVYFKPNPAGSQFNEIPVPKYENPVARMPVNAEDYSVAQAAGLAGRPGQIVEVPSARGPREGGAPRMGTRWETTSVRGQPLSWYERMRGLKRRPISLSTEHPTVEEADKFREGVKARWQKRKPAAPKAAAKTESTANSPPPQQPAQQPPSAEFAPG